VLFLGAFTFTNVNNKRVGVVVEVGALRCKLESLIVKLGHAVFVFLDGWVEQNAVS
jgi:hypothetical protein